MLFRQCSFGNEPRRQLRIRRGPGRSVGMHAISGPASRCCPRRGPTRQLTTDGSVSIHQPSAVTGGRLLADASNAPRMRGSSAGHQSANGMSLPWTLSRQPGIGRSSVNGCRGLSLGALPGSIAPDCPVNRRPGHSEWIAEFGGGVFAGLQQRDQVGFLAGVQFGLLAPQPALRLRDLHALWCEDGSGRPQIQRPCQHVEQQPADRVGRVVHGATRFGVSPERRSHGHCSISAARKGSAIGTSAARSHGNESMITSVPLGIARWDKLSTGGPRRAQVLERPRPGRWRRRRHRVHLSPDPPRTASDRRPR